jgi:glyoxylase-like metal-dependent hydrolase (beta-lactamase superfamily II)
VIVRTLPVGPLETNCYLVGCEQTRLGAVIDPGGDAADILAAVQQDGLTVRYVLLTHAHFDHIGGAKEVMEATGAPLALHPDDLPILRARGGAAMFGLWMQACPEPTLSLADGQVIELGTVQLHVLHTPGHAPGHVTFHAPGGRAAFDGDVLFQMGIGRTDLPGCSFRQLMDSIHNKLFTLPDDTVIYPGHGPATTVADEKRHNPFLT